MIMGDSLAIQIFHWMEEALGALAPRAELRSPNWTFLRKITTRTTHPSTIVTSPTRGGGMLIGWRINNMLSLQGEGHDPWAKGSGWLRTDVDAVLGQFQNTLPTNRSYSPELLPIPPDLWWLDVMEFRSPVGWIKPSDVTEDSLSKLVSTAYKLFRVRALVLLTIPMNNNIKTLLELTTLNTRIRSFAQHYHPNRPAAVQTVLVCDYAQLTTELIRQNAVALGYPLSDAFVARVRGLGATLTSLAGQVCGASRI
jgi:hypothetical protein